MTKGQIEEYVDTIRSKKEVSNEILEPTTEEVEDEEESEPKPLLDRKLKFLMDLSDEDKNYIINKLK